MVPFCCYVVLPVFDILYAISNYVVCNPPEIELQSNCFHCLSSTLSLFAYFPSRLFYLGA